MKAATVFVIAALHAGCGMSINSANLPNLNNVDPDPPPETVPMTARLSAYPSMSIHVVAAQGVAPGPLGQLREKLVATAQLVKRVPAIVDDGATGALDLRVTVQRLEQETDRDGDHQPCEAVVLFELFEVAQQRLLASFTITARQNDQLFSKAFDPLFRDVSEQFRGWLIYRTKKD